ncbi:oxaloacetate decarboxylase [Spongiibacter sp. KMU-166]|uniref:Oxaloacetate decarboxylase n=1 Tax=Spongiibacter thalassae TaxID=2721624 RepID=A0ABX1G9U6_9GAMM|nr:oxaloacetate decarboxylase [Spongiibacter thalassae]NKI15936.1 oxaloacetate decarboxylase [Spongiibacter thalassae]
MMKNTTKLRNLLKQNRITPTAGVHDPLGARILQDEGFELAYMSGNGTTAAKLGMADIGYITMREMVDHARNIVNVLDIPLICDSDTGFGSADSIVRTVREWEGAGVAGIHIEDQTPTKRCGAMKGVQLVDIDEAVARIRTAVNAKRDPDFVIIARTDAISVVGIDEAIKRAHAFYEAGADMVYIENFQSREQMEIVGREFKDIPIMVDSLEAWPWTLIPYEELGEMGFNISFHCLSSTFAYTKALKEVFSTIKSQGTTKGITDKMVDLHEYERLLGIDETSLKREN